MSVSPESTAALFQVEYPHRGHRARAAAAVSKIA